MRGRKPKPSFLRLLDGNAAHRPLNAAEPQPEGDLTEPPEWMNPAQRESWRYAIENAPRGLLKRLDRSVLTAWVVAESLHAEATQKVTQYGPVIKAPITGVPIQSPYLAIVNKQAQIMMRAAAELGFTPSSRTRVAIDANASNANPFEDLKSITD